MNQEEYKPIGSDTIKIYGFSFGMHRYQVEHFDHNKCKDISKDDNQYDRMMKSESFWDTIYGTRIFKFFDSDLEYCIHTATYFSMYIEEDELKQMILDDVIEWVFLDPYDFKDRFFTERKDRRCRLLFPSEKEDVKFPYPECEEPYEKCPHCGGELDDSVLQTEYAEDVFNSHMGTNYYGEPDGWWHEVHRCPHCGKLFFVEIIC